MKFQIGRNQELSTNDISRIIQIFSTRNLPRLNKLKDYYDGKQKIMNKQYSDPSKPISKICVNFCNSIVNQYQGYLSGIPIKYRNDNFKEVLDILNYNDITNEDNEYLHNALMYGVAYECNYIDLDGRQRFKVLDSRECIPVYSDDLDEDLLYIIRFWKVDNAKEALETDYYIEVYGRDSVKKYTSAPGFSTFNFIAEEPNYFKQVPITVFKLNNEESSVFEQVVGLQDAYNELISSQLDDWSAFVDAYLVLKGAIANEEELASMKENRVLMLDPDASAEYLTKNSSNAQVSEMLTNYKEQIYDKANCPDFTKDTFNAQSGIAIRYKLINLENAVANIEAQMKKALQRRIELISAILNLTGSETTWRDIEIVFSRNLPQTLEPSSITELMQLKGLVSDETLLAQLPFIKNVDEELAKVKAQTESNYSLYNFGNTDDRLLEESGAEE